MGDEDWDESGTSAPAQSGFDNDDGGEKPSRGFGGNDNNDGGSRGFGGGSRGFGDNQDGDGGGRGGGRGRGRGRGGGGFGNSEGGGGGFGGNRGFNGDSNEGGGGRGFGGGRGGRGFRNDGGGEGGGSRGFGGGGGGSRGFGNNDGGEGGGSRGFGGGGGGSRGFGNNDGGEGGGSRGFGGGSRGFGNNDGGEGGGSRGFGNDDGGDDGQSRGFGGGRGRGRGGGRGGGNRGFNYENGDGEDGGGSRGFGGNRGFGGGSSGNRGFGGGGGAEDDWNVEKLDDGVGGSNGGDNWDTGASSGNRGFGSNSNRGFGNSNDDGWGDSGGNKGFGSGSRGFGSSNDNGWGDSGGSKGFGGGSRGFGSSNDDGWGDSGGSRGFGGDGDGGRGRGGGRGGRGGGGGRGFGDDNNRQDDGGYGENADPDKPKRVTYVPAERSEDDETLFGSGVSVGINFSKYDEIEVKVSGENVPPPIKKFQEAGLRDLVLENISKSGYDVPTPIQKYSIPILMGARDLMGCAQTGSGKTAAFLIPIINTLMGTPRDIDSMSSSTVEPRALIVAPTRELAIQIDNEARKFAKGSVLKCQLLYGGVQTGYQLRKLFSGCDILVATTGRLKDLVDKGKITFQSIEFVVLDEADRMLDMGFLKDVEPMIRHDTMPPAGQRQTLMFSATFPSAIQELAGKFLHDYIFVAVGIIGSACTDIEQRFIEVGKREKRAKLVELLEEERNNETMEGILIFVETKQNTDFLASYLSESKYPATSIHGDREQKEREEAVADFKYGRQKILVATSVAARGLDMKNVRHVINYDLPKEIDEYIHRIGRTGRVGNKGKATSFYDSQYDNKLQEELIRILTQAKQEVPEWMGSASGDYGASASFGGQDIRDVPSTNSGYAQPVEQAEEW